MWRALRIGGGLRLRQRERRCLAGRDPLLLLHQTARQNVAIVLTGGGIGVIPSSGEVKVAATPEPRSRALLSFGLLAILVALGGKQFFTTRLRQA